MPGLAVATGRLWGAPPCMLPFHDKRSKKSYARNRTVPNPLESVPMHRLTVLAFVLLALSTMLSAQTVDDIIAKNIVARGGLAKLAAVQTIRGTADYQTTNFLLGDVHATLTQVLKRPGKVRVDWSFPDFTLIQAYDGQNGWQILRAAKKKQKDDRSPMTARDVKLLQEQGDIDGPLVDWKQKGSTVELAGREKVGARDAYNLQVTFKDGEVQNFYLDADSFLLVKASGTGAVQGVDVRFERIFSNYKEVQGVMLPFSIEARTAQVPGGQQAVEKTTFQKVEVNVPLDELIFIEPGTRR